MYHSEDNSGFSFSDLLFLFAKHLKAMAVFTIGFTLLIFLLTKFVMSPKYEADAAITVNAIEVAGNFENNSQSNDDFQLSQAILNTCVEVMKSSQVMDETVKALDLDINAQKLGRNVKITPVVSSEVIDISVTYQSPKDVKEIAQKIISLSQAKMKSLYKGIKIDTVAPPKLSDSVSPNVFLNTVLGFLAGLFLSALLVFLKEKLSVKIRSEYDLKELELPVLSILPQKEDPQSFRYLADNLTNIQGSGRFAAFAFASSMPGEGKEPAAAGAARVLSSGGKKVLLIDADASSRILSGLLERTGKAPQEKTGFEIDGNRIECYSAGGVTCVSTKDGPDMSTEEIAAILKSAGDRFDVTLINTPPVALFGNLPTFAMLPVGFVLITRQGLSDYISAGRSKQTLQSCGAKLLGCVMTGYNYRHTDRYEEFAHYRRLYHTK